MSAWNDLAALVRQIDAAIERDVPEARREPERRVQIAACIRPEVGSWGSDKSRSEALEVAKQISARLVGEYRQAGEDARDERLGEIADRVDQLRASLCAMAAAAAIDLANHSRQLRAEAKGL